MMRQNGCIPGAYWFSPHDVVNPFQHQAPMSIPKKVAQDYPPTLGIKADELHRELHLANMRYGLLRGFAFWVSQQRNVEGMTIEAVCDAADRALQGDAGVEGELKKSR